MGLLPRHNHMAAPLPTDIDPAYWPFGPLWVENAVGTAHMRCRCLHALDHYRRAIGALSAHMCTAIGCSEQATDGAHVLLAHSHDRRLYIVPTCRSHNMQQYIYEVRGPLVLASAAGSSSSWGQLSFC